MVSAEDFVRTWQASSSLAEAADSLGMPTTSVSTRAVNYRKKGIDLKKFRRGGQLNVASLKKIAAEALQA